jgi:heme/copper-type cytochrome/quinol oxidase subunit 2
MQNLFTVDSNISVKLNNMTNNTVILMDFNVDGIVYMLYTLLVIFILIAMVMFLYSCYNRKK